MFWNKLEEHIADSAPCSSCFDGFDRGDDVDSLYGSPDDNAWEDFLYSFVGPLQLVDLSHDFFSDDTDIAF